jgi:hypothetical protein
VKEFLKEAGGNWLRADLLVVGDILEILGSGKIDDETFDSPYLVLPMRLQRTGEEYNVRLGAKNAGRLTDTLGTAKTEEWVGRKVEVVSIEQYKGLGTKGFILRGLPKEPIQTQISRVPISGALSPEAIDVLQISKDLVELGMGLNQSDWNQISAKVRAELIKYGFIKQVEELYVFTEAAKKFLAERTQK